MIDTSKLDEPRWYVLHTFTGYEAMAVDNLNKCIAKNNLQDYILEVKIPMETVIEEGKNGKKKAVERKLFPCYILIKMIQAVPFSLAFTNVSSSSLKPSRIIPPSRTENGGSSTIAQEISSWIFSRGSSWSCSSFR